jgi:hypothetical protein
LLDHRARLAFGAGIVDSYVQPAEARDGQVDHIAYVVFAPHVRLDERRLRAEPAQFGFQGFAFGFAPAGYSDRCAFFGKGERRGAADAGQSAGNEDNRSVHSRCPLKLLLSITGVSFPSSKPRRPGAEPTSASGQ